jgi:hypothetical protein
MRRLVILLTAVSLLALPAAALAQSAGDEQYSDPFSQADQPNDSQGQGTESPEPTAPTQTTQTSQAPAETAQDPAPGPSLPATGLPIGLLAGTGLLLLAGGTTLRRQLS